jgi:hypothetical protein
MRAWSVWKGTANGLWKETEASTSPPAGDAQ